MKKFKITELKLKGITEGIVRNSTDKLLRLAVIIVVSMNVIFMCYQNSVSEVRNENLKLKLKITELQLKIDASKSKLQELSAEYVEMTTKKNAEMSKTYVKLMDTQDKLDIYYPIMNYIMKYKHYDSFLGVDFIKKIFFLSETKNINPYMVLALIDVESQFDKNYHNGSQIGLMQLSKPTAKWIHSGLLKRTADYDHEMLINPVLNVSYGLEYLSFLQEKYNGDYNMMLKEYCGGFSKKYEKDKYYETVFKVEIISSLKRLGRSNEQIRLIFQPFNK